MEVPVKHLIAIEHNAVSVFSSKLIKKFWFQDSLREKETEWERELKQYMDKSNLSDKTVGDKSPKEKLSKDKTTKDNISFDKSSTSP